MHRVLTISLGLAAGGGADARSLPGSRLRRLGARPVRVLIALFAMLAALGPASCGSAPNGHGNAECGQTPATGRPPRASGPRSRPTGGAGSVSQAPHNAPPPTVPPTRTPVPTPTPVNGRVSITAANTGQTIVVPAGTLIDVRLEPVSGARWAVPESSDPHALPRLSASGPCDTVKTATFRADGAGEIDATRPEGDAVDRLVVMVRVGG